MAACSFKLYRSIFASENPLRRQHQAIIQSLYRYQKYAWLGHFRLNAPKSTASVLDLHRTSVLIDSKLLKTENSYFPLGSGFAEKGFRFKSRTYHHHIQLIFGGTLFTLSMV